MIKLKIIQTERKTIMLSAKIIQIRIDWIYNPNSQQIDLIYPKNTLLFNKLQLNNITIYDDQFNNITKYFTFHSYNSDIQINAKDDKALNAYKYHQLTVSLFSFYQADQVIGNLVAYDQHQNQLTIHLSTFPEQDLFINCHKVVLQSKSKFNVKRQLVLTKEMHAKTKLYAPAQQWGYAINFSSSDFQFTGRYQITSMSKLKINNQIYDPGSSLNQFFKIVYDNNTKQFIVLANSLFLNVVNQLKDQFENGISWQIAIEIITESQYNLEMQTVEFYNQQSADQLYIEAKKIQDEQKKQIHLINQQPIIKKSSLQAKYQLPDLTYIMPLNTVVDELPIKFNKNSKVTFLGGGFKIKQKASEIMSINYNINLPQNNVFDYSKAKVFYPNADQTIRELKLANSFRIYQGRDLLIFTATDQLLTIIKNYYAQTGFNYLPALDLVFDITRTQQRKPLYQQIMINQQRIDNKNIIELQPIIPTSQKEKDDTHIHLTGKGTNNRGFDIILPH